MLYSNIFGCKHVLRIMLALIMLASCSNDVKKEMTIGHCIVKETNNFKLFSQDNEHISLLSPQTGIMVYIGKSNSASSLHRIWENYTILDKNYKIEQFNIGSESISGIITKSVHRQGTRIWVHIPINSDTFIRIDYPESQNGQDNSQIVVREFLASVTIKH